MFNRVGYFKYRQANQIFSVIMHAQMACFGWFACARMFVCRRSAFQL